MSIDSLIVEAAEWIKQGKALDAAFTEKSGARQSEVDYIRDQIGMILEGFFLLPVELRSAIFILAVIDSKPGIKADDVLTHAIKVYISRIMEEELKHKK